MPGLLRTAGAAAFAAVLPACVTVKSPRVKPGPPDGAATRGLAKPASAEAVLPEGAMRKILSGMLALVEAQHTYYVHVTHNTKFAADMRELGSNDEGGGTVMLPDVWNANADAPRTPLAGYYLHVLPYVNGPAEKDGFAVGAVAAQERAADGVLPVFLTVVRSAKGGMLGMCSTDTWMVRDPELILRLRAMLRGRARLDAAAVSPYAPSPASRTRTITPFSTSSVP